MLARVCVCVCVCVRARLCVCPLADPWKVVCSSVSACARYKDKDMTYVSLDSFGYAHRMRLQQRSHVMLQLGLHARSQSGST